MKPDWSDALAPSLDDFSAIAARAFAALPSQFQDLARDLVIHIENEADPATLKQLGIEDPFELTGLYEGVDVQGRSIDDPAPSPSHVYLYRLPILAEWIERSDVTLSALIAHVLVHEIGHHFGLSDDDMHAIEEAVSD